ncbi:MAG: uracil-DNA glycosylase [Gammaproteobacteria bacterium]|nr:uracil-DNA glycosylase [Gammaproteobacteria bacterium]
MALSNRKKQYLKTMGIPVWSAHRVLPGEKTQAVTQAGEEVLESLPEHVESPGKSKDINEWKRIQQEVSICTACDLHQTRTNTVFGVGNNNTELMIIGEAPGQDEDRQGEPFVGKAGQLLNQMLLSVGFSRESVFIANILKCRPPNNRDPRVEEVMKCADFLKRQIEWIRPKMILSVGRISAHNLLKTEETIGRLRGKVHHLTELDIPVIVTYHPAYLLRSPAEKAKSWRDLVIARRILENK